MLFVCMYCVCCTPCNEASNYKYAGSAEGGD